MTDSQSEKTLVVPPAHPAVGHSAQGWMNGFLGMMIFSGSLPATRVAVLELDPLFLTAVRAAIAALTAVRNSGSSSSTATRVAGSEPLKIIMPRKPFIQPWAECPTAGCAGGTTRVFSD